jgi:S-adenosylmethionine-diacylglycerol 3-amino-3-carboxypropyl transferase
MAAPIHTNGKEQGHGTAAPTGPRHRHGGNPITRSVVRKGAGVAHRLLDHAFALAFRGLVYAQIWEDPDVDMEALQIRPDSRVVAIASGGCNVLSYLVANPEHHRRRSQHRAYRAQQAQAGRRAGLPDHAAFHRFSPRPTARPTSPPIARTWPLLDEPTRRYWEGRDLIGRRRIGGFSKGIYKRGLLGNFIGVAHLLARLYSHRSGADPAPTQKPSARCSSASWPRCSTSASCAG